MKDPSRRSWIPAYFCYDCGSEMAYRSRRRTFSERYLLPLFLMKPVRCGECYRRDYRLVFTPVRERWPETRKIAIAKVTENTPKSNVA